MANSYFISHCTCKCTNILFILLLDLATLKQWSASFFMWQEENFTIHVNILVPSFKIKYAVDTGQPWHTLQMVVLLISTLSNTEVIPYLSVQCSLSIMKQITGARCKCPLSSNLTKCLILSIIPCTRNITNGLGFNTCFLISSAVLYIIKLIFLQFVLLSFPLHFATVTRNTFRQKSSCLSNCGKY